MKNFTFRYMRSKFPVAIFLVASTCISCAGLFKLDIEARLISEMEGNCSKIEIKRDYEGAVYVIANTGKLSKGKCPLASIRAWKKDALIEEKEVEICGCREGKGR